jgi:hypothetical protein
MSSAMWELDSTEVLLRYFPQLATGKNWMLKMGDIP